MPELETTESKLAHLKCYLRDLPKAYPEVPADAPAQGLLYFTYDPEWAKDIGILGAVNRSLECALTEYLPRNDKGIFFVKHRGPAMEALATVLEYWLKDYPDDVILLKWLTDSLNSAKSAYKYHGVPLPVLKHKSLSTAAPTSTVPKKTTAPQAAMTQKKLTVEKRRDTKTLEDWDDPKYEDVPEPVDTRNGGAKTTPILFQVSRRCQQKMPDGSLAEATRWRCIASAACNITWGGKSRDKGRILLHAGKCTYNGVWKDKVEKYAVKEDPVLAKGLKLDLKKRGKRDREDDTEDEDEDSDDATPAAKRHQSLPTVDADSGALTQPKLATVSLAEGKKILQGKVNRALVPFIVACGLPSSLVGNRLFIEFIATLNKQYQAPSRSTLEEKLIPNYAKNVRQAVLEFLQTQRNLTITYDGGKLIRKKFWSVHATTAHRQSFCLQLDDDLCNIPEFKPTITDLRSLLSLMSSSTFTRDLFDAERKEMGIAKGLLTMSDTRFGSVFWSIDSVLVGYPALKRVGTDMTNGLEEDSKVRELFGDEDTAHEFEKMLKRLHALLLPFARSIQCLEGREITPADPYRYWLAITAQVHDLIITDDALSRPRYSKETKEEIRRIANHRFSDLIENEASGNVYLTAFFLDPDNRAATIYSKPNPLVVTPVVLTAGAGGAAPKARLKEEAGIVSRVGESLLKIMRREYDWAYYAKESGSLSVDVDKAKENMKEVNPYLASYTPREALELLKTQLPAYERGDPPFNRKREDDESLRDWWFSLRRFPEAKVLAALAIKIFSTTPTSIVDERAMSIIKWINTTRRNRQLVGTVDDHLAIHTFVNMDKTVRESGGLTNLVN
ncbi:ribonuclease H-like domain-containing protein [Ephemerocybe angulata]|uniref:Ribonuclease H-like domain-containing protein n=1 Tax=Ephemerocybe angulata TaxID=980116 RepID=A0A8H6M858_9AGAR|nr:ribonuclease H-like domain-containing protein [Tulosesus angulatus]